MSSYVRQMGDAYRSVAHEVVDAEPELAHGISDAPVTHCRVICHEWDRYAADRDICDRQAEEEIVADRLQLLVHPYRDLQKYISVVLYDLWAAHLEPRKLFIVKEENEP